MIGLPSLRALDQAQATRIWLAVVLDGIDVSKLKCVPRYERGTETNHAPVSNTESNARKWLASNPAATTRLCPPASRTSIA